jgi:hypothetical protein
VHRPPVLNTQMVDVEAGYAAAHVLMDIMTNSKYTPNWGGYWIIMLSCGTSSRLTGLSDKRELGNGASVPHNTLLTIANECFS